MKLPLVVSIHLIAANLLFLCSLQANADVRVGEAFQTWLDRWDLVGDSRLPGADPDQDGRINLEEFAFNGNPINGINDEKFRYQITSSADRSEKILTLTLPIRDRAKFEGPGPLTSSPADGIIYHIQGTLDLKTFTKEDIVEVDISDTSDLPALDDGWSYRSFKLSSSTSDIGSGYLRAVAQEIPSYYLLTDGSNLTPSDRQTLLENLGLTATGRSFFSAPHPDNSSYPRLNSDGTVTMLNTESLKSDLGISKKDLNLGLYPDDPSELPLSSATSAELSKKVKIRGEDTIFGSDYGIIGDDIADDTAALQMAINAAAETRKPLILSGSIKINGPIVISGQHVHIIGRNCVINQYSLRDHGLTLHTTNPLPYGLKLQSLTIVGRGSATHDAAGIYGRKADLSYLTSDIDIKECIIQNFRTGISVAGIAKFQPEDTSIMGARVGMDLHHLQTSLIQNCRIVHGDGHPNSVCFNFSGGNQFANTVLMGEFGGINIARFANIIQTTGETPSITFDGINCEAFTSPQIVNITGNNSKLIFRRCRWSVGSGGYVISAPGNSGTQFEFVQNFGMNRHLLELHGPISNNPARITGDQIRVFHTATQGGDIVSSRMSSSGAQDYVNRNYLPLTSLPMGGQLRLADGTTSASKNTDEWVNPNPMVKYTNNHTGTLNFSSTANDVLSRTLSVGSTAWNIDCTPAIVHSHTLPKGTLWNNGESIEWVSFGFFGDTESTKRVKFIIGSEENSAECDFGDLPAKGVSWKAVWYAQRSDGGSGPIKICGVITYGTSSATQVIQLDHTTSDPLPVQILVTGEFEKDIEVMATKAVWNRTVAEF